MSKVNTGFVPCKNGDALFLDSSGREFQAPLNWVPEKTADAHLDLGMEKVEVCPEEGIFPRHMGFIEISEAVYTDTEKDEFPSQTELEAALKKFANEVSEYVFDIMQGQREAYEESRWSR